MNEALPNSAAEVDLGPPAQSASRYQALSDQMNAVLADVAAKQVAEAAARAGTAKLRPEEGPPNFPQLEQPKSSPPPIPGSQPYKMFNPQAAARSDNDYGPLIRPQRTISDVDGALTLAVITLTAIIFIFRDKIMHHVRKRASLIICAGAGLVLANLTVADNFDTGYGLAHDVIDKGWISLFGGLITLIGIYRWIGEPPPPRI